MTKREFLDKLKKSVRSNRRPWRSMGNCEEYHYLGRNQGKYGGNI